MSKSSGSISTTQNSLSSSLSLQSQVAAQQQPYQEYLRGPSSTTSDNPSNIEENIKRTTDLMAARNADVGGGVGRMLRILPKFISSFFWPEMPAKKTPTEIIDDAVARKNKVTDGHAKTFFHHKYCYTIPGIEPDRVKLHQIIDESSRDISENPENPELFHARGKAYFDLFLGELNIEPYLQESYSAVSREHNQNPQNIIKASHNFDLAISHNSSNYDTYFRKGLIEFYSSKTRVANNFFKEAHKLAPDSPWLNHFMGLTASNQKEAESYFLEERKINPNSQSLEQLGLIHYRKKDYAAARELFEKAAELDPNAKFIHLHIGQTYLDEEKYEQALHSFRKEQSVNPAAAKEIFGFPRYKVREQIGHAYLGKKEPEKAVEIFSELIGESNHYASHYENPATALVMLNKFTEAAQDLRKALNIRHNARSDNYNTYSKYASTLILGLGFDTALEKITTAIDQTNPPHHSLFLQRASLYFEESKNFPKDSSPRLELQNEALKDLDHSLALHPT